MQAVIDAFLVYLHTTSGEFDKLLVQHNTWELFLGLSICLANLAGIFVCATHDTFFMSLYSTTRHTPIDRSIDSSCSYSLSSLLLDAGPLPIIGTLVLWVVGSTVVFVFNALLSGKTTTFSVAGLSLHFGVFSACGAVSLVLLALVHHVQTWRLERRRRHRHNTSNSGGSGRGGGSALVRSAWSWLQQFECDILLVWAVVVNVLHAASLFASSLIEEEHQFWYLISSATAVVIAYKLWSEAHRSEGIVSGDGSVFTRRQQQQHEYADGEHGSPIGDGNVFGLPRRSASLGSSGSSKAAMLASDSASAIMRFSDRQIVVGCISTLVLLRLERCYTWTGVKWHEDPRAMGYDLATLLYDRSDTLSGACCVLVVAFGVYYSYRHAKNGHSSMLQRLLLVLWSAILVAAAYLAYAYHPLPNGDIDYLWQITSAQLLYCCVGAQWLLILGILLLSPKKPKRESLLGLDELINTAQQLSTLAPLPLITFVLVLLLLLPPSHHLLVILQMIRVWLCVVTLPTASTS